MLTYVCFGVIIADLELILGRNYEGRKRVKFLGKVVWIM